MIKQDNTGGEKPWNSGEEMFPGMTCGEASRFMAAFVSAFRILSVADELEGRSAAMSNLMYLIEVQQKAAYTTPLKGVTKESAKRDTELGLAATSMATIFAVSSIDSRQLAELAMTAVKAAGNIMDKMEGEQTMGNIRFVTRIADDGKVEVGCAMESLEQTKKAMDDAGISDLMLDFEKKKDEPGKQ